MTPRSLLPVATFLLCLHLISPGCALAADTFSIPDGATAWQKKELLKHPKLVKEGELYLLPCRSLDTKDDIQICKSNRIDFLINYVDAFYNHIVAQQNVAFDLGGDGGTSMPMSGILINHLQSCAWRLAILSSGGPAVDSSDLVYARGDCSHISPDLRVAAAARAKAIDRQIAHTISDGSSPIFTSDELR